MRKLLVVATVSVLGLSACGGGGGGSAKTLSKSEQQQINDLHDKAKTATFTVTYANQDEKGNTTDTWTLSQQGADKKAYITKDSKFVVNGDKAYNCDISDGKVTSCDEVPGGADGVSSMITGFAGLLTDYTTALGTAGGAYTDKTSEQIAGQDALCLKWTLSGALGGLAKKFANSLTGGDVGWQSCIDKNSGVTLRVKYLGGRAGTAGIVATNYSDKPNDADFDTPTTTTMPDQSSSDTTAPDTSSSSTTTPDTSGSGGTTTTVAGTPGSTTCVTLPTGITLPSGITLPCVQG